MDLTHPVPDHACPSCAYPSTWATPDPAFGLIHHLCSICGHGWTTDGRSKAIVGHVLRFLKRGAAPEGPETPA
jgi:hypothetical protein